MKSAFFNQGAALLPPLTNLRVGFSLCCSPGSTTTTGADPEEGGAKGASGHGPPPNCWIIMLHNLFNVGKCIGSMYEGPFFWFSTFAIKRAYEQNFAYDLLQSLIMK